MTHCEKHSHRESLIQDVKKNAEAAKKFGSSFVHAVEGAASAIEEGVERKVSSHKHDTDGKERNTSDESNERLSLVEGIHLYDADHSYRFDLFENDPEQDAKACLNNVFDTVEHHENSSRSMMRNMAHELKTPLTNLKLVAEGIRDGIVEMDSDYVCETIDENVSRMDKTVRMMSQCFGSSMMDTEDRGDVMSCFFMAYEKAKSIADAAKDKNSDKDVDVSYKVSTKIQQARGDGGRLEVNMSSSAVNSILSAVIENCFDHASGMTKLVLEIEHEIHPSSSGACAKVVVHDDGKDASPILERKMTEPFWKADESHARKNGKVASPGLGLSMVKSMLDSVNGEMKITCTAGIGTKVEIWLPLSNKANTTVDVMIGGDE